MFYDNGLSINVLLEPKKRAVGFKPSEGMEFPAELGSYFVIKGEWSDPAGDEPQRVS